jgi:hypothetical protein
MSLPASATTVSPTPLPISTYGSLPSFTNVKLSPSGNALALIKNINGTLILTTYNLINHGKIIIN